MSSSGKLRIILDSTYLLPIVGIGVEDVDEALLLLKRLRDEDKAEYYYSPFSLLEILGKLSRLKCDQGRVSAGQWVAVHGCGGVGLPLPPPPELPPEVA